MSAAAPTDDVTSSGGPPDPRIPPASEDPSPGSSLSGLRSTAIAMTLTLLAFIQQPGSLAADTKFDLVVDPGRFLSRATHMWDQVGAFGQIQNQAYGYFFPMGPFFWVGDHLGLDMWVVQRLWWALLLNIAFWGARKVIRELGVGSTLTQLAGATSYALGAHITTVIGGASVEVWPTAMAPWVLWALIRGTRTGSERRWAALAALFVVACGGVNAAAVSAVLPLGVCWIVTRSGRRRWVLLGWWVLFTALGTLWWLIPLMLMGRYSFPFLDYIENAPITTAPTDLFHVLSGSSNWVAYVDRLTYQAGNALITTPYLVLDLAAVVALGLVGCCRKDTPHRQFLLTALAVGITLVGLGYAGPGHGLGADVRQSLLDGVLSPLRNVHKFDAVLRLPLAIGVAHALTLVAVRHRKVELGDRMVPLVAGLVLLSTIGPWFVPTSITPTSPPTAVPGYWKDAARYLNDHDDGSRVLVLPASAFGTYTWGWPHDDVLQALMTRTWGVRNVIPLAQPGNVVLLDAITQAVEAGEQDPGAGRRLARVLAQNGIGAVVVRNDLDRLAAGSPDPSIVRAALADRQAFAAPRSFGPLVGLDGVRSLDDGTRIVVNGGVSARAEAVQVFRVLDPTARATLSTEVRQVAAAPGAGLQDQAAEVGADGPVVLAGQAEGARQRAEVAANTAGDVVTDTLRRRETAFANVRDNVSATMSASQHYRLNRLVHTHEFLPDQEAWNATMTWTGVRGVDASSSGAWADSSGAIDRGAGPEAALDSDPDTAWISNAVVDPVGEWWQVDLKPGTEVAKVRVRMGSGTVPSRLRIGNGSTSRTVQAGPARSVREYDVDLGPSDRVRITADAGAPVGGRSTFSLAEVEIPGVSPQRYVSLPSTGSTPDGISLNRDQGTSGCVAVLTTRTCIDGLRTQGDDGDTLARTFSAGAGGTDEIEVQGSLRSRTETVEELSKALPFRLDSTAASATDVRASQLAMVDGLTSTTWVSGPGVDKPRITIRFPKPVTVGTIDVGLNAVAPVSRITDLTLTAGAGQRRPVKLQPDGHGSFDPVTTRRIVLQVTGSEAAYDNAVSFVSKVPVGITELAMRAPGSAVDVLAAEKADLSLPCGRGPEVRIGSTTVPTSFSGTLREVMAGRGEIAGCRCEVTLSPGRNRLLATPTSSLRIDHVTMRDAGQRTAPTRTEPATVRSWTDAKRVVEVGSGDRVRLLSIPENANDGWTAELGGRKLDPITVDGWRQGWWVPAGEEGAVTLTFGPQRTFALGLGLGVVGLIALVGAALWRRRSPVTRPACGEGRDSVWFLAAVPVAGLVWAGWGGLVLALVAAGVCWLVPRAREMAPWAAGALVLGCGGYVALRVGQEPGLIRTAPVQLLLFSAVALAAFAGAEKPRFLNRDKGRSTT